MKVCEMAELLRCQVPRRRAEGASLSILSTEDMEIAGPARFAARKPQTQVLASLFSRSEKFLLRENDILIVMAGGMKAMGATALVAFMPEQRTITSKNLLIVRPKPEAADAVWLYYRLAQDDIRERLIECVTQGRTHYLAPDGVGNLEIRMPSDREIEAAHAAHKIFIEGFLANSTRLEKEMQEWQNLARLMKADG